MSSGDAYLLSITERLLGPAVPGQFLLFYYFWILAPFLGMGMLSAMPEAPPTAAPCNSQDLSAGCVQQAQMLRAVQSNAIQ